MWQASNDQEDTRRHAPLLKAALSTAHVSRSLSDPVSLLRAELKV
jgi:hypothetical protein